jgi:hypothetical protein
VELVSQLLGEGPYGREAVAEALGTADVLGFFADRAEAAALVWEKNDDFYPRQRATHVLQEAERVLRFKVRGFTCVLCVVCVLMRAELGARTAPDDIAYQPRRPRASLAEISRRLGP